MQNPAVARLLADLDPLPFPARMRLLAVRTLQLASDGGLDEVLDALAAGAEYERGLGLEMAKTAGLAGRLIAALDDPLYRFRVQAMHACLRLPDAYAEEADRAVLATLDDAPLDWRKSLAHAISAAGRTDLADRLVTAERERLGDVDAARLLATCSDEVAGRLLPELLRLVPNRTKLARRHPKLMLDFARAQLADMPEGARDGWWGTFGLGLMGAAEHAPLRLLDLLEEFPLRHGLPQSILRHIHPLIRADADRVIRLLTVSDGMLATRWQVLSHSTRRGLIRRGLPELELVGRAFDERPAELARMLRDLAPSVRSAFFDAVTSGRHAGNGLLHDAVSDALPHARRHAEARRMLKLEVLADWPEQRLAVVARLPWEEALPDLRVAVRRAEASERAAAYPLLIGCAAATGNPATVTELLTGELGRLRNEQDPVRVAAVSALALVPPELFAPGETVADALLRLVVDAVEARDGSRATRDALRRLACRVLARQVAEAAGDADVTALLDWSLLALEHLAGSNGSLPLGRLDRVLRRGQEHAVYQAIEPWIDRGLQRADHRLALELARALGRRAWAVGPLQERLEQAIWNGTTATSGLAIALWLEDPARRDERVGRLVDWDPTTATKYAVADTLGRRRTDLLDRYLGGEILSGRFIARGAVWVPNLRPSARWLPRQLTAYADLLAKIAADAGAQAHARVNAIRGLGALPGENQRRVLRYLDSTNVPLAEAALGALAWSDDPAAVLPLLLGYADGDRARVAVYAATRAARYARPSAAASALRSVALSPTAKVTSRKEVLRVAAELEIPGLVELLVDAWQLPGQHRDVKAAAVSRLADQMDDPRVLPLLREAVTDDPAVAATLLQLWPFNLPERHRAQYGELIASACALADPNVSATALNAAPRWYRWAPSVADAVCGALTDLDRHGERKMLPQALFTLLREGMPLSRLTAVLEDLLAADAADDAAAADRRPDRDRPARRRLLAVVRAGETSTRNDRVGRRPALTTAADALADRVGYVAEAAALTAAAVDLSAGPEELTTQLLGVVSRAAGRYDAAIRAGDQLSSTVQRMRRWNEESVLAAAETLARQPDPAAGLIVVRLLATVGVTLGWPGPFRLVVRTLRQHPDPVVAEAALELDITPTEPAR